MAVNMGMGHLGSQESCLKRKFRWIFRVDGLIGDKDMEVLMPLKGGRPNLGWKEIEAQHIYENIYLPGKPDWKPIQFTLYDHKTSRPHPIMRWVQDAYRPERGEFYPIEEYCFKKQGELLMLDGCGETMESWTIDNMWPQQVNFGELDYGNSEVVTCDVTFRYDRAYIDDVVFGEGCSYEASERGTRL